MSQFFHHQTLTTKTSSESPSKIKKQNKTNKNPGKLVVAPEVAAFSGKV